MHGENLRKFTKTRALAPRERYAPVSYRSTRQYVFEIPEPLKSQNQNHDEP
jgi:hypothetical protein